MNSKFSAVFLDLDDTLVVANENDEFGQENFEPIKFHPKWVEQFRKFLNFMKSRKKPCKIYVVSSWRFLENFDEFLKKSIDSEIFDSFYDNHFNRIEDTDNESIETFIESNYENFKDWVFIGSLKFFHDLKRQDRLFACVEGFSENHLETLKSFYSSRSPKKLEKKKISYNFEEMFHK